MKHRIAHVTFNMGFGGTEQVIRQLIGASDEDELQHCVLCIDGHVGEMGVALQESGCDVLAFARRPGLDLALVRALAEVLDAREIDVVHGHQYTPWVYAVLASLRSRRSVFFTEHGRFHPDQRRYKRLPVNPLLAARTKTITAISRATADALVQNEFIARRRIEVIYNGIRALHVDADRVQALRAELGLTEAHRVVGTVARLDPIKNQAMLLEAFATLSEAVPQARLLIVGDGPLREALVSQAGELGIAERVLFTGFLSEPAAAIALMDVFALSSRTEGTSMTLLEAMSLSRPCVVTDVGGNPEIVEDGTTGNLVPSGDAQAFSDALRALLEEPARARALGEAGRERFESRFSVDQMVQAFTRRYREACGA